MKMPPLPDPLLETNGDVFGHENVSGYTADQMRAYAALVREECAKEVPTSWLDPLLTGSRAVIGQPPYNCGDIERVLRGVATAIRNDP